ncbi:MULTISPECIES: fumarylacetoacetate hydrolase family protein [unclassified Sphingomonas]|jgi:2-keto-4-pentenoate hydratase/2-oxohepta-3-ene-1,7-dioic acid hydratase in catechol pathway|uniref:fumarylacetoacetate hydrolase family protein n=1 Tax=unclassified Sphingomonas TaxID=196159 RepID=UPI001E5AFD2C|nr:MULTISPECIES: fumarylacetoacetate hydrolase family protein [unclassified Sphingomonas]
MGVVDGTRVIDLREAGLDFPDLLSIIHAGQHGLAKIDALIGTAGPGADLEQVRLLAPIERPGKYLAIGMNYRKHAEESERIGVATPKKQLWFNKQTTCISGPFDDIDPGVTEKLDYEVELGVIIGRRAKSVTADDALSVVFGYFVANDVSARDWQFHTPTFTMGKSFDTHGPIGPWIVTADEIPDPQSLALTCRVNGELRQSANTSEMVHSIADQIGYLSTAFTLEPGDLIATGTPEGVGVACEPPVFLQQGDIVRCEIETIGFIENRVALARQSLERQSCASRVSSPTALTSPICRSAPGFTNWPGLGQSPMATSSACRAVRDDRASS